MRTKLWQFLFERQYLASKSEHTDNLTATAFNAVLDTAAETD